VVLFDERDIALGASVANGVRGLDAFNFQHASWSVKQTGNPRGGKADFTEGIGETIDFGFHGRERVTDFWGLGKNYLQKKTVKFFRCCVLSFRNELITDIRICWVNSDNQKVNVVFSHSFRDFKIEFAVLGGSFFD
jgi:hypothetical protein